MAMENLVQETIDKMNDVKELPEVIGMPPTGYVSDALYKNSTPIMEISPKKPHFVLGATVFKLDDDWGTYTKILNNHGFSIKGNKLKVAFLADNFPTDSFTNEYGQSYLQSLTNITTDMISGTAQMAGFREGKDISALAKRLMPKEIKDEFNSYGNNSPMKNSLSAILNSAGTLVMGGRMDFPIIWKNSSYTPSYTITVRLYNPNVSDEDSTKKYITGPLAALLLLGIPLSSDGFIYSWPFLHNISVPGIFRIPYAFISNITVVKGGDQQMIGHNQRLGSVDVRIDFGSLFNSIIANEGGTEDKNRPSLKSYLDSLGGSKDVLYDTHIDLSTNKLVPLKIQKESDFEFGVAAEQIDEFLSGRVDPNKIKESKTLLDKMLGVVRIAQEGVPAVLNELDSVVNNVNTILGAFGIHSEAAAMVTEFLENSSDYLEALRVMNILDRVLVEAREFIKDNVVIDMLTGNVLKDAPSFSEGIQNQDQNQQNISIGRFVYQKINEVI